MYVNCVECLAHVLLKPCCVEMCFSECYVDCLQFECVPIYVSVCFVCFMFDCVW